MLGKVYRTNAPREGKPASRVDTQEIESNTERSSFERFFQQWVAIEQSMIQTYRTADESEMSGTEDELDVSLDTQTSIMSLIAKTPGRSVEDVVYKLALWRRDCAATKDDYAPLSRSGKLVLSALHDLVALTGQDCVLSEKDSGFDYARLE